MARSQRKYIQRAKAPKPGEAETPVEPPKPLRNQVEAEALAKVFTDAGFKCVAMQTKNVGGMPVEHGWAVNVHDHETGFGMVAVFWGFRQFRAYTEFVGSKNDAPSVAITYMNFLARQRELAEQS